MGCLCNIEVTGTGRPCEIIYMKGKWKVKKYNSVISIRQLDMIK